MAPKTMPAAKSENDWQAEYDHRTLQRASDVMGDASRMKAVARHHQKMTRNMASVASMLPAPAAPAAPTALAEKPIGKPTLRPKRRMLSRSRAR